MKLRVIPNFQPMTDKILVRLIQADDRTPGGIILPDSAKQKSSLGTVMAAGPDVKYRDEPGDDTPNQLLGKKVYFQPYAGYKVEIPGVEGEYLVMKFEDILGVLLE